MPLIKRVICVIDAYSVLNKTSSSRINFQTDILFVYPLQLTTMTSCLDIIVIACDSIALPCSSMNRIVMQTYIPEAVKRGITV